MLIQHGAPSLLAAATSHDVAPLGLCRVLARGITETPLDVLTGAAVAGALVAITLRRWTLPVLAAVLVVPGSEVRVLTVPVTLLVGVAWAEMVRTRLVSAARNPIPLAWIGVAVAIAMLAAVAARSPRHTSSAR